MAANTEPIFAIKSFCGCLLMAAANAARDGTGTINALFTTPTDGSLTGKITFTNASPAIGNAVAKVWRIWISDTGGTSWFLYEEIAVGLVTSSATAIGQKFRWLIPDGLFLQSGQKIGVTQSLRATSADDTHVVYETSIYS